MAAAAAAAAAAAKKRKPEEEEEEVGEEEMHLAFRGAANALSHVYTQAVARQKASFHDGERRALEDVYQWVSSQLQQGSRLSVADIVAYLQNEMEHGCHGAEETPVSPQCQFPHHNPQPASSFPSANVQNNAFTFGNVTVALNPRADPRMGQTEQARSAGFSNALSSPLRQNPYPYHPVQCPGYAPNNSLPNTSGVQIDYSGQGQEFRHPNSYDSSMDMHHE